MDLSFLKNLSAKSITIIAGLALVILVVLWGVGGYQGRSSLGLSGTVSVSAPDGVRMNAMGMAKNIAYDSAYESAPSMMPVPTQEAPAGNSRIIKNGDVALIVESVDAATKMVDAIRIKYSGQVGNAFFNDYSSSRTGDMTVWVPSEHFDAALAEIKAIALRVATERISVTDVSAQFVDLEARLKNLRATEAQIVVLLGRSGKISEVLEVTRELSNTRQQIEQLQGQLNYLSRQVALSSIHITLTEELATPLGKNEWRPMTVIRAAWRDMLRDLTDFIDVVLVFLVKLPLILLQVAFWGVILYALWLAGRALHRRLKGDTVQ